MLPFIRSGGYVANYIDLKWKESTKLSTFLVCVLTVKRNNIWCFPQLQFIKDMELLNWKESKKFKIFDYTVRSKKLIRLFYFFNSNTRRFKLSVVQGDFFFISESFELSMSFPYICRCTKNKSIKTIINT